MEAVSFDNYFKAITPIECHESLQGINVSMFPNMKKEDRKKLHRQYKDTIKHSIERDSKPAVYGDVVANLKEQIRRGK